MFALFFCSGANTAMFVYLKDMKIFAKYISTKVSW